MQKKTAHIYLLIPLLVLMCTAFFYFARPHSLVQAFNSHACTDILSTASTPLKNKLPNRIDNLHKACAAINGTTLASGGTFSFNRSVGERTEKRGYKPAPSFIAGKVADSVGGGVCQLSSTLYHACLLADLQIIKRTHHSFSPDYLVQAGLDATVDFDAEIDFVFKNNTPHPLQIFAHCTNEAVCVQLTGTKTSETLVEIESKILYTLTAKTHYKTNPNLKEGETKIIQPAFNGCHVQTYRILKDAHGNEISRRLEAKCIYKKLDGITERGGMQSA
ncbi:MAG: VanW family protein [Firmicutes bacterium]|nr:VanW family protein [Bacillota bacterium]